MFAGAVFGHRVVSVAIATHYVWRVRVTSTKRSKKRKIKQPTNTELIFSRIKYKWLYRILRSNSTHTHIDRGNRARANRSIPARAQSNTIESVFFPYFIRILWFHRYERGSRLCLCFLSYVRSSDKNSMWKKEMNQIRVYGFISSKCICLARDFGRLNEFINRRKTNSTTKNQIHT